MTTNHLERKVNEILARNKRVEADKAWEISWTRRGFIVGITYSIAVMWLLLIHDTYPLLKAGVPVFGYILSTLSLPILKKWWLKRW